MRAQKSLTSRARWRASTPLGTPPRRLRQAQSLLARWTADMDAFDFLILALVLAVLALGNWPPTI